MMFSRYWRLSMSAMIVTAGSIVNACQSGGGNVATTGAGPDCKDPQPQANAQGLVPLNQAVKYLTKHYPRCIPKIAGMQALSANYTNVSINTVQGCPSPKTQLTITPYKNTHSLNGDSYGDDDGTHTGKQRGFIVARITNNGDCAPAGHFPIPAHATVFWVLDHENGGQWASHFIRDDNGTGYNLVDRKDYWNITACVPQGGAYTDDLADIKDGDPCTHRAPGNPNTTAVYPVTDDNAVWIVCGGDCCYSNAFI